MNQLQPVIWTKGTLLGPQHLQAQDRFIESSLRFRMQSLLSNPWGFLTLQVNQEALNAGDFSLSQASGIFPDGLLFDFPASDPAPPSIPLGDAFEPDQDSIDIYLAIPADRPAGLNVSIPQQKADTRFLSDVISVRDENSGTQEKPVQIARKNFRYLTASDPRQECTAMCAARVCKNDAGIFQLDPQFIPPLLDFTASDYLRTIARRLVEILAAKSSIFAGVRRQKNLGLADFGTADIAQFWLLYTVNSHFPEFNHLYESGHGHPERLFDAMLSLAGCLTTFSAKVNPRDLPVYRHDNLSECVGALDEIVRTLLETVVPSNFVSLPLKPVQPSIYATALADDKYLSGTRMYLAVSAEMNQADLISKVPDLAKVCSANHIEHLLRQALPGAALKYVKKPPGAIPVKLNCQYFGINQSGAAWEAVVRARNLAVYIPSDFPSPQLELIILLPEQA
ncbi:MAG: type VI secretion system baseplate subunit TssK [Acidobacteria bacterium]|nr:type VI secretion system baseplate subunit TssK [Acidobacteriota bacterium]